jgi:hypothetical protein
MDVTPCHCLVCNITYKRCKQDCWDVLYKQYTKFPKAIILPAYKGGTCFKIF